MQRLPAQPVPEYLDWELFVGPAEWRPYHEDLYRQWWYCSSFALFRSPEGTAHSLDLAQSALGKDLTGPVEIHPPEQGDKRELLKLRYADGSEIVHYNHARAPAALRGNSSLGTSFDGRSTVLDCREGMIAISPWYDLVVFDPPSLAGKFQMKSGEGDPNRGSCAAHYDNFLDCVRTRRRPNADVEINQRSFTLTHLACIGYRLNRRLRWDPVKEDFVNDAEASRYLDTALRAPWRI